MHKKVMKLLKKKVLFQSLSRHPRRYCRSLSNRIKYGPAAPKFEETIWVNPGDVTLALRTVTIKDLFGTSRLYSALVIEDDWPFERAQPFIEEARIAYCIEHWDGGKSWEEAGAYDYMLKQVNSGKAINFEYNSMDDIYRRYRSLDNVFEKVKIEGKFKTENELNPAVFGKRSESGVIHIGPGGEPFFGGGAHHRFAIAYVLNIAFPAKIGLVHVSAIPYLDAYRKGTYKS